MDAVAASCDARSGRIEVEVGRIRSIDRSRGTECPKSGAACRSEVGWSGMKGMFYVVIPRGPGPAIAGAIRAGRDRGVCPLVSPVVTRH